MRHRIIHDTIFSYDHPVHESVMEVRLHPCSNNRQRCEQFTLQITPKTAIHTYVDAAQNIINHFQIPGQLTKLHVRAESMVEVYPHEPLPTSVPEGAWGAYETIQNTPMLDMLLASTYAKPSVALDAFMHEHDVTRKSDPLSTVRAINTLLYQVISYTPQSTTVDSTIDDVLAHRKGVCQDISHLMIAMCRRIGIPARYISGYLYHRRGDNDRSQTDATHAWVEVWIPGLGWAGFDPTNNMESGERHITVATGRDYADVTPTRGIYRGVANEALGVSVRINDDDTHAPLIHNTRLTWPTEKQQQQQQQ
ncbi:MAG: hypothetical protein RLY87_1013 [Chloroflexota bacterium]